MSLQIQVDIAGNFVTEPATTIIDGVARERDPSDFTLTNIWLMPNANAFTSMPVQITAAWPATTTGKLGVAAFNGIDPTKYEQAVRRAAGDVFIQSKGPADGTALTTVTPFPSNQGFCFEFYPFQVPGAPIHDLVLLGFGQWFTLHLHGDGTCDLVSSRPSDAAQPMLAKGRPLTGTTGGSALPAQWIQVIVLPYRRDSLYIWTSLGAAFSVYVGARADTTLGPPTIYTITEAAQVAVTCNTAARAAFLLSVLQYPPPSGLSDGDAALLTSPVITLKHPLTSSPTATVTTDDRSQVSAGIGVVSLDTNGNPVANGAPTVAIQYMIGLQTASSMTGLTNLSPIVYDARITWPRALGTRTYETATVSPVVAASFVQSRDRGDKRFSFTLDNAGDAWTSLKDIYNRVMQATFTDDGAVDTAAVTVFTGLTDPAEFTDGVSSRIVIPCSGLRKNLKTSLMNDDHDFGGMTHAAAVSQVLQDAGIGTGAIVTYEDGITLDSAPPGEEPLWRPANGTSRDDFIQHICDTFSGYVFDDIGGVFYYVPQSYFTAAAIAGTSSYPEILLTTPIDEENGYPTAAATGPNPAALVATKAQETSEEPIANDVYVLGMDAQTDQIVMAHYEDTGSITDRTAGNYVGTRKQFIYVSASITSVELATRVCGILSERLTQPIKRVTVSLPDFQLGQLPLEGPVTIDGYGLGIVTSVDADLTMDRCRTTEYVVELLPGS